MEQQSQAKNDDGFLTLATRKCLFRLLSFLDSRLPEYSAIHSFVCAALLTANPSSHVYFRKTSSASGDEENYSLIIGLGVECFVQPNQQTKKCWTVTAWTDDDEKLASAYEAINIIDWNTDAVIMHYKFHAPHPAIDNLVKNKHGEGKDYKFCYPGDQYFMPVKDALNFQISEIDGVYVKSLERCHAHIVYDYWPYRESTTVENITREIELLPSAGVFLKGNDQLVSWMMCHPPNGMSRLHTLEEHRRRGYAALVTQYLSKRVAQCGFVPFVNIVIENTASYKFFERALLQQVFHHRVQLSLWRMHSFSGGNLAMEQQRRPDEKDHRLTLATRNCLFRLLSFLDSRLPDSSAIHSFVHAALITANPSYQVYFRQQRFSTTPSTDLKEDDYSLIIGIRLEHCMDVNQQLKKFWNLTAWTLDNEKHEREMASAFEELNMIDWNSDVFTMRYKHHTPPPAIMNFLIEKQGPGLENKRNIPCNQYYLPKEDALSNIKEIEGVYVKSLERCHAQTVYDHWPYKGHTTLDNVSEEIEQLPSAGVFLKENDQLVSWMMCSPPNGMSRIYTLEEYRHRGYAALVTKYLSKRVAQSGLVPFVNIHIENQASHKFFESVGFKLLGPIHLRVTFHDS